MDEVRSMTQQAHVGRDLTPDAWPDRARVGGALSFGFYGETSWLYRGERSSVAMSRGDYGARVGVPRTLDLLDRYDVLALFFMPAVNGQLHPEAVDAILAKGRQEVGVHGWIHERVQDLSEDEDREVVTKSFDYWTERLGESLAGIRMPSWHFFQNSLGIIRDIGFIYDSSLIGDDRPYEMCVEGEATGLVELPIEWLLDDHPFQKIDPARSVRSSIHPGAVREICRDEFATAAEEGTFFLLTMHPKTIGHRALLRMIERLIQEMGDTSGVWIATHEAIARYVLSST